MYRTSVLIMYFHALKKCFLNINKYLSKHENETSAKVKDQELKNIAILLLHLL